MPDVVGVENAQQLQDAVKAGHAHIEVRKHIDLRQAEARDCSDGQACLLELADGTLSLTVRSTKADACLCCTLCFCWDL